MVAFCRLRFAWWPIHPILFVFLGSHQAQRLAFSFFLGWLVKTAVHRYGGARLYQKARPVMMGIIAGEIIAALVPMIIGVLYYFFTGERPVYYSLLI